jgi:hypothetical protein
MSFTATTLSSAIARDDTSILVASLTGFVANQLARVDGEIMKIVSVPSAATIPVPVIRGVQGTAQTAHPVSARVIVGATATATGTDWTESPMWTHMPMAGPRIRTVTSYSASGAIALPAIGSDAVAILNGTSVIAATLANPSTAQDGDSLIIIGNGIAAHTVTYTAGLGNVGASADVITFSASQGQGIQLIAAGGFWVMVTAVAGAASVAGAGIG